MGDEIMLDADKVGFYNDIYRRNPAKWSTAVERDVVAFFCLSGLTNNPKSVLDVGCGNGHTLAYLKSKWPDAEYTGVDISDVALRLAKIRLPDGEFYQDIPAGQWDVITIMGVAEHFENPSEQLRIIGKHLTPQGYLYLEVPNCIAYSPDKSEGFRKTHAGADQSEWHWQRNTWNQAIQDAGLAIIRSFVGPVPAWQFIWILRAI
jgi:trans-aconitate methyltransferase